MSADHHTTGSGRRPSIPTRGARLAAASGLGLLIGASVDGGTGHQVAVGVAAAAALFALSELIARLRSGDIPETQINWEPKILGAALVVIVVGFVLGLLLH